MSDSSGRPDRIFEIGFAFRQSQILLSAVYLDLFTVVGDAPAGFQEFAGRLGIHQRGAREFFDALVTLQLLRRDEAGRYRNMPDADRYLDRRSPKYIGDLFEHLNGRMYATWGRLTEGLRSGLPQSGALGDGGYSALYADKAASEQFLNAMSAGSVLAGRSLAAEFPWHRYDSFIDIGAAQGCVPVEIARVHPHMTGGGFDLPEVEASFQSYVRRCGLDARLKFFGGDFLKAELPSACVLIMGRILHNWGLSIKKLLLGKAYRALPMGGALLVYDRMYDESRGNLDALLAGLTMLLETADGSEYSVDDCCAWMREAGFQAMEILPLDGGYVAVVGHKTSQ